MIWALVEQIFVIQSILNQAGEKIRLIILVNRGGITQRFLEDPRFLRGAPMTETAATRMI